LLLWLTVFAFAAAATADELFVWRTAPWSPGLFTRMVMFVFTGASWFDTAVAAASWLEETPCQASCVAFAVSSTSPGGA
jgi:hypothetical protein